MLPEIRRVAVVLFLSLASAAHADENEVTTRSLTLAAGRMQFGADLEISLSKRQVYEPVSLAPDVYLGVTDALTLGLVHSFRSQSLIRTGRGFCLTGQDGGCPEFYRGTGIDLLYALPGFRQLEGAGRMRLSIRDRDPLKLSWKLGLFARRRLGRIAVVADPHIALGITHADLGNETFVDVPVWLQVQASRAVVPYVRTGVDGVVAGFADTYRIPLGLGLLVSWQHIDVGVEAALLRALGPQNDSKPRSLRLFVTWRPRARVL